MVTARQSQRQLGKAIVGERSRRTVDRARAQGLAVDLDPQLALTRRLGVDLQTLPISVADVPRGPVYRMARSARAPSSNSGFASAG
jgi:CO dehydrogenase nickel-insertion accessory protein CooC1